MSRSAPLARWPVPARIALGLALFLAVFLLDATTHPDLSFLVFYLGPVFLLAWLVGERVAQLVSLLSAAAWYVDDAVSGRTFAHPAIPIGNLVSKLAFFLLFAHLVAAFRDSLRREEAAARERLESEVRIAASVQRRLFPQLEPQLASFAYAAVCRPARVVSGDYYDLLPLAPGRLGLTVADVSGKGLPAALLMASVHASVRGHAAPGDADLAAVVAAVNRDLCAWTDERRFVTLFLAVIADGETGFAFVNAGHNPGLLVRRLAGSVTVLRLEPTGPVLGVRPEAGYAVGRETLEPGDTLVIYSDGVTEAMRGDEAYGEERLVAALAARAGLGPGALRDALLAELDGFLDGAPVGDDLTLVVARRN